MESWLTLAQNLGISAVCLFALGFSAYKMAGWVGVNLIIPIRNAHMSFLTETIALGKSQAASLESIASSMHSVGEMRTSEQTRMIQILSKMEEIADKLDRKIENVILKADSVVIAPGK